MLTFVFIFLFIVLILLAVILFVILTFDFEVLLFYKYKDDVNKLKFVIKVWKLIIKRYEINFNVPRAKKRKAKKTENISKYIWRVINTKHVYSELYIKVIEGAGDAAFTAITHGILFFAAEIIKVIFEKKTILSNDKIEIICDFNKKIFLVDISCIFKLKLVNIISEVIKLYRDNKNNDKAGDVNV